MELIDNQLFPDKEYPYPDSTCLNDDLAKEVDCPICGGTFRWYKDGSGCCTDNGCIGTQGYVNYDKQQGGQIV